MTNIKDQSLVIVYHRQPYEEIKVGGKTVYQENKSPNGIVHALKGFFKEVGGAYWIAWKQINAKTKEAFQKQITIESDQGTYEVLRLGLSSEQVKSFYHLTSKEALWPTLHSFPWLYNYDGSDWKNFCEVNYLFAEKACEVAARDNNSVIWIHDYNLWLVPSFIRKIKPDATIAFFHHTPFPAADIFNILPWRDEIIDSLLCADMIGFHIPRYSENFVNIAKSLRDLKIKRYSEVNPIFISKGEALAEPNVTELISYEGRDILIDTWPIGTNVNLINENLNTFDAGQKLYEIKSEIKGRKLIIAVSRVDYTKGTKEMLLTFDRLLGRRPELVGKVKLFVICVAPAQGMQAYKSTQKEIEHLVGNINGHYSKLDWSPIMLTTRPVPFNELICYYKAADICWITPLRDGLNLVAKEYIASKAGSAGVLILSEFAGSSVELPDAIKVNPFSGMDMDRAIDAALDMEEAESITRMKKMYEIVRKYDIVYWSNHVLGQFKNLKKLKTPVSA